MTQITNGHATNGSTPAVATTPATPPASPDSIPPPFIPTANPQTTPLGTGTIAVHAGAEVNERDPFGAVTEPISLTSTYRQYAPAHTIGPWDYNRDGNPNRESFQRAVAALEGAKHGLSYSSGSVAISTVLQSLPPGSHVVSVADVYGGTHRYFTRLSHLHGVETSFSTNIERDLVGLIRDNTRLVWIETPSNPTLSLVDIAKTASLVRSYLASQPADRWLKLVVDNTFLSPYIQRPLALGADMVVHSVSKYLNGHSDVIMGVIALDDDKWFDHLRFVQKAVGAVPSPFDCWLARRGLRTLHLRLSASSSNALAVAQALEREIVTGRVLAVNYPGLKSNPRAELVRRQHRNGLGGGMLSFRVRGGAEAAANFCRSTRIFTLAESLGGVESLIEVPAAMTHVVIPKEQREASGVYDDLIRVSCGVEDAEDLVADVLQALDVAASK